MSRNLSFSNDLKFCLLGLAVLLMVGASWAEPTISLSKSYGPPTTKLLVSGSGFDPNVTVNIYFDRQYLASADTDASGAFGQTGIQVPASAKSGVHWVTALEDHTRIGGQA